MWCPWFVLFGRFQIPGCKAAGGLGAVEVRGIGRGVPNARLYLDWETLDLGQGTLQAPSKVTACCRRCKMPYMVPFMADLCHDFALEKPYPSILGLGQLDTVVLGQSMQSKGFDILCGCGTTAYPTKDIYGSSQCRCRCEFVCCRDVRRFQVVQRPRSFPAPSSLDWPMSN